MFSLRIRWCVRQWRRSAGSFQASAASTNPWEPRLRSPRFPPPRCPGLRARLRPAAAAEDRRRAEDTSAGQTAGETTLVILWAEVDLLTVCVDVVSACAACARPAPCVSRAASHMTRVTTWWEPGRLCPSPSADHPLRIRAGEHVIHHTTDCQVDKMLL